MKHLRKATLVALAAALSLTACDLFNPAQPEPQPTVAKVAITPATATVWKGQVEVFTAEVTGTNNPDTAVTWSIETAGKKPGTTISAAGKLTVAADEALATLTIKATSKQDNTKSATATATITFTGTVDTVAVLPSTAEVQKGEAQEFTAVIAGTNTPPQTVTWSIVQTDTTSGTAISAAGKLTVAKDETLEKLTVKATSTANTAKSGTATVTITAPPPTVSSVTVSPATISVQKGTTKQFTATVAGTGTESPSQEVTWSIVETGKKTGTTITAAGLLTIAADEALTSLTVKATSTEDTAKNGTATVTITAPPPPPSPSTVTSVTVSPSNIVASKGETVQWFTFSAIVNGTNNPSQAVTWSIVETNKKAGTTISADGRITIAADEALETLTIKATSTQDTTKSGTATVTVTPQRFFKITISGKIIKITDGDLTPDKSLEELGIIKKLEDLMGDDNVKDDPNFQTILARELEIHVVKDLLAPQYQALEGGKELAINFDYVTTTNLMTPQEMSRFIDMMIDMKDK